MTNLKQNLYKAASVVAIVGLVTSPALVSAASDTDTTTINATVGSTITVSTSSTVALSLSPGASAVLSSNSDAVSVSTNESAGYTLDLENSDAASTLVSGGDNITAHAGTYAAPTALATGTWGYAVAALNNFDATYSAETNAVGSTTLWAGVPVSGSAQTIRTTATTASNEVTTVWYAAEVDSSQPTGVYSDTVTYTATTN